MKKRLSLFVLAGTFSVAMAQTTAAPTEPAAAAPTTQQNRMVSCNKEAGEKALKGDPRKAFMKSCLSGETAGGATTQQNKMKTCNADAGTQGLKGDERKKFMSACLKG